jgi:hypothetical protein
MGCKAVSAALAEMLLTQNQSLPKTPRLCESVVRRARSANVRSGNVRRHVPPDLTEINLTNRLQTNSPTGVGPTPSDSEAFDRLYRKVEAVENLLAALTEQRFPTVEGKLEDILAGLVSRRKDFFLVEEVAAMTGRSAYTVRRWILEKKVKATRIAEGGPRGRLLIPRAELERLVAAGQGAHVPEVALDGGH